MAEREGFEPPVACATAVFKTAALSRTRPSLRWESKQRCAWLDLGYPQLLHPLLVLDQRQVRRSHVEHQAGRERRQQPRALAFHHRLVLGLDDVLEGQVALVAGGVGGGGGGPLEEDP